MSEPIQEFPKMLYAHPVDKTQEHKTLIVNTSEEKDAAMGNGWKEDPHIPVVPEEYETNAYELKWTSAGFAGTGEDPSLISLEEQQANLAADVEAYKAMNKE